MKIAVTWAAAAALLVFSLPGASLAHRPEQHGFELVRFEPPLPAPDFALTTPAGAAVTLRDFRGKTVLLNFWATWCPPCVREMPSMEALYQRFKDKNFTVLAISLDKEGAARVTPFVNKLKLTFPIALDPDSIVSAVYGAGDLPSSFLLDPEGRVIAAAKGERDWFSAEARSYMKELLDRLRTRRPRQQVTGG